MIPSLDFPPMASSGLSPRGKSDTAALTVRCQLCQSETELGLDLGPQPIGDLVLTEAERNQPETFYPLQLCHCGACGLTQLTHIVDPKIVYKNFPFLSGTTQVATRHLQSLPPQLMRMGGLARDAFALDIGSNDGTLLKAYRPFGVRFLGVDPSGDPVRIANEQGIPTLHAFFNEEIADYIARLHGSCDAISACGVFAHIADIAGVMRGVKKLLKPSGIFASDSQYWLDTMQGLHYDNMFHQHLRYYSLRPLRYLFQQYEMDIFDVARSQVYGGSIRVFSCHKGAYPISNRVRELEEVENEAALYQKATHDRFAQAVSECRKCLFDKVYRAVSDGRKVIGIGAPAKASTVSNYCRLGPELLSYITEVNSLRIGKYLPGVRIPIVNEECMFTDEHPPDAGVLFAWNYYDEIVPKMRARGFQGAVLTP